MSKITHTQFDHASVLTIKLITAMEAETDPVVTQFAIESLMAHHAWRLSTDDPTLRGRVLASMLEHAVMIANEMLAQEMFGETATTVPPQPSH